MARLILSLDNQVLAEYNMTKERYTVGRLPDNDVRIDNPAVSGHHSLIINILNDSFLEDLNSTNGTYVNGKLIKKHALQHGDVITIGHHQLRFSDQQTNDTEQDEFEKTMVIPTGQQNAQQLAKAEAAAEKAAAKAAAEAKRDKSPDVAAAVKLDPEEAAALQEKPKKAASMGEKVSHTSTSWGIDKSNAPSALPLAKLQVLSGAFAGRELELTKALTTLGRPGVQVAAITRRAEGYYIVHVESGKEGDFPLVNGQPTGAQARKLQDNDVVQLAGVKMGFFIA
ncbi:MAG: FHA domain-containing protein [Gammaproteobacteria bacterium]|nr:FHA domain-containing protein [Gammaproteobacteria bacterium]MDH5240076.1 FHA domain-containing protein [Gammaproteobacteria bacterium]MDH5260224.1 FHA domain-containing protein [Gammaproteobacteria bacterium]MDH5583035.1 FHA domain-containing protein [Gammaproteobacteria bacterium]